MPPPDRPGGRSCAATNPGLTKDHIPAPRRAASLANPLIECLEDELGDRSLRTRPLTRKHALVTIR
jgi:hypothetical protein